MYFQENQLTKNQFFCELIFLDFRFLHFLYKIAINRTACGGQKLQKLPKITTLWKSLAKAIDHAYKISDTIASDPARDSRKGPSKNFALGPSGGPKKQPLWALKPPLSH